MRKICRDMEMCNQPGHRPACTDHFNPFKPGGWRRPPSLPDGFHDEADDHRQSHAAAHDSDDYGRDFACRGP